MATNRDLLKEAIADAKAVKEMAIANAKQALEEAFTPQLKDMLSAKLHEMEELEEEFGSMNPNPSDSHGNIEDEGIFEEEGNEEELNLDELLAELEEGEDEPMAEAEDEEAEETDEEEAEEGGEGEEDEDLDLEDMTMDDFKSLVADVMAELEGEDTEGEDMEGMEGEGEVEMDDEEEDVNIDELLAEILEEEEELEEGIIDWIKKKFQKADFSGVLKPFLDENDDEIKRIMGMEMGDERTKAANQLLNKFESFTKTAKYGDPGVVRSDRSSLMAALKGKGLGGKTGSELGADISALKTEELSKALAKIEALEEALKVKDEALNEVNLLNAKLLYTNKIFKSKTLTESQKAKVLATFDKATNVSEVKLIHETLNTSLNASRKPINESKGSASQVMGTTKTKSIINENDAFARMRELAFYSQKH